MSGFQLNVDWDEKKALTNRSKHGVAFEVATTAFFDPNAQTLFDSEHSTVLEKRWITTGRAENGVLLVVIHTWEDSGPNSANARLISARCATKTEQRTYEENLQ